MIRYKESAHKRNWNARNNSSNVAAILKPTYHDSNSDSDSDQEQIQKYCLSNNTCYCQEKPLPPKLFPKPKHYHQEEKHHHHHYHPQKSNRDPSITTKKRFYENTAQTDLYDKPQNLSVKQLQDFRKDHFFETHSTDDLLIKRQMPEHECIHQFEIDDRFLAKARNGDEYGISHCVICGKAMETNRRKVLDENKMEKIPKYYKYGLEPRPVYMGNANVKLEISMGDREKRLLNQGRPMEGFQRPYFFNTYALRYQRGVKWP